MKQHIDHGQTGTLNAAEGLAEQVVRDYHSSEFLMNGVSKVENLVLANMCRMLVPALKVYRAMTNFFIEP